MATNNKIDQVPDGKAAILGIDGGDFHVILHLDEKLKYDKEYLDLLIMDLVDKANKHLDSLNEKRLE